MNRGLPRVIHIITGLSAGGAERSLFNLLNGGLTNRFENQVVSLSDEGAFGAAICEMGVQVDCLAMRRGFPSLSSMVKLRQVVRRFQPDVVQGWMYHGNMAASLVRDLTQSKSSLAWNIRQCLSDLAFEKPMTRLVIRVNRRLSNGPEAILYNSCASRNQHAAFGITDSLGIVIPNGFDLTLWSASVVKGRAIREELGIPAEAVVIGHVARFHPMKDHPAFLRAAVEVASRKKNPHFLLSGRGVDSGNLSLVGLVPENVRARFHFLGERSDVPDLMRAMDVFCLSSSRNEAFPNVLGEAMATEVPCVATDVGDSASIVGDTGTVVPPRDEGALAAGLMRFISMSTEERCALGAAARARVRANYALEAVVKQYVSTYDDLVINRDR